MRRLTRKADGWKESSKIGVNSMIRCIVATYLGMKFEAPWWFWVLIVIGAFCGDVARWVGEEEVEEE